MLCRLAALGKEEPSLAAWICRVPVRVYFLRGLRLETAPAMKRSVLLWLERVASACANVVIANSESLLEEARTLGIAASGKLTILGDGSSNGVDVARFSPGPSSVREEHGIPADAHVIGFVGRLTADKGVPELIEAFAAILREEPGSYLLLVGWFDAAEDALDLELRARIEGHPRIVCTGYVADTAPFYRAMDLLVLPSWREGFPNVVLEAASTGLPVVATTCTGSRDAVKPEITGLQVPPGDPAAIADAVLRILRDGKLIAKMGNAARSWAVKHFDQDRVPAETVRFYRQLLNEQADGASLKELSSDCSASL